MSGNAACMGKRFECIPVLAGIRGEYLLLTLKRASVYECLRICALVSSILSSQFT